MLPTPARNAWSSRSGFRRPFRRAEPDPERAQGERVVERLRAVPGEDRRAAGLGDQLAAERVAGVEPDPTELADVAEAELATVGQLEDEPDVGVIGRSGRHDEELPGHLQVDRQGRLARQLDDDELGPPVDGLDPAADDARRERRGVVGPDRPRPGDRGPRRWSPRRSAVGGRERPSRPRAAQAPAIGASTGSSASTASGVGPGERGHRVPVVADLDVDGQGHVEPERALHRRAQDRDEPVDLVARAPRAAARRGPGGAAGPGSRPRAAARRAGSSRSS